MSYDMSGMPVGGVQAPSSTQQQSRYPQLDSILRTEEGFKNSIQYTGGTDSAISIVLVVAVLALVWNLIDTFKALSNAHVKVADYFWQVFFIVEGTSGKVDPVLWCEVWLPIIAIPVLVVLLVVRKATRGSSVTKILDKYRQAGFLAELVTTGINIRVNNNMQGPVCLIGPPNIQADLVTAAAQRMTACALSDPKSREAKDYLKAVSRVVTRGFGTHAYLAKTADPSLPDGIYVTGQGRGTVNVPVRIAIPAGSDFTSLRLYALKKTAPLA